MNNMVEGRVSVLIGTYNRASLLERCLNSVFGQSYSNIEVIVIDDASTDNTNVLLSDYKERYCNRFTYIRNEFNRGIAYNSNLAFSVSTGQYIALIGDDDYWIDPDKLMKQIGICEEDSRIGVVGTWWIEKQNSFEIKKSPEEPINWKKRLLTSGGIICGSTPLIPRKVWVAVGGFDDKMQRGTDSEFFRRIILTGYTGILLKQYTTVVDVGHTEGRMTQTNNKLNIERHLKSQLRNISKYRVYFLKYPSALVKRLTILCKLVYKYVRFSIT